MQTKQKIKVNQIFSENMGLNLKDIKDDLAYNDCPNWDSLKHLQMISQFETEFNIDIEMDDVIAMITVRDIYKILAKYLK